MGRGRHAFICLPTFVNTVGETISGRLPDDLVRELDELGRAAGKTRSEMLREVVQKGVAVERIERALDGYRRRALSLGRASEMAGVPITAFLDELRRAGILLNTTREDLAEDLAWVKRAKRA